MDTIDIEPTAVIGLISDTHDTLPTEATEALADADVILHLGDLSSNDILIRLRAEFEEVHAVRGNTDHDICNLPETLEFNWGLWRLFAVHIRDSFLNREFDLPTLGLYGHTHEPRLHPSPQAAGAMAANAWLNPGPVQRAPGGRASVALLRQHADSIEIIWRFFRPGKGMLEEFDTILHLHTPLEAPIDPLVELFSN